MHLRPPRPLLGRARCHLGFSPAILFPINGVQGSKLNNAVAIGLTLSYSINDNLAWAASRPPSATTRPTALRMVGFMVAGLRLASTGRGLKRLKTE